MSIGKRITKLRNALKMTQEELAEKLDVSRQSIFKWEKDLVIPEMDNIIRLSKVFNVSLEYLVNGKKEFKNKVTIKDYLLLALGVVFLILIVVILIINPDSLLETSSALYFNGLYLLIGIALIFIIIGLIVIFKKRNERK
ncbi:MAG: helix-turn-helix transcriptional regulator [Acholeplasmatales bacterium]|jgi:transcriptional regulator with XRE-family HTH domain|nr:helix-turn-helix domain-containing protein [Acholeplasmataceae bacterium]MDY0115868.1 helix-turn-helix transcriptional regulator [Acholeplasmatales bacterium]MCK9234439.1 helix-turn-helix domain-containing protein [Acholeplasmataceae bacterium]MCK9289642.1 helix-turn-helix domain-containing protein [Acholeplasmataceae bacterium]MCK9427578.1 helix-turn-helix domain-containing protein [Acholeplasmataceae bacterium]